MLALGKFWCARLNPTSLARELRGNELSELSPRSYAHPAHIESIVFSPHDEDVRQSGVFLKATPIRTCIFFLLILFLLHYSLECAGLSQPRRRFARKCPARSAPRRPSCPSLSVPSPDSHQAQAPLAPKAMAGCVPNSKSLSEIYYPGELGGQEKRWNSLISSFKTRYGCRPDFVARSPGRVNIIGEHIDYSLYPVLPMAISADTIIAVSSTHTDAASSSFEVEIANLEDDKFSAGTFSVQIGGDVDIDAKVHDWVNYFKAGLRGAFDPLRKRKGEGWRPVSMKVLLHGTVPVGGGLSSSAAFTTASALAVMLANGEETIDKTELTELAIVSERAVGVNSGGYDFQLQSKHLFPPCSFPLSFLSFTLLATWSYSRVSNLYLGWINPPPSFRTVAQLSTSNLCPPSRRPQSASPRPRHSSPSSSLSPTSPPRSKSPALSTTTSALPSVPSQPHTSTP